jgi:flagellar motor component MotA
MYLIGVIAFIISLCLPMSLKGVALSNLLNPAALFVVLLPLISTLLATSGFKLFVRGLNAAISHKYHLPDEERTAAADLFRLLSKVAIAAAVFGVFLGLISMLGHMGDVEQFGHALAATLVSPLYGVAAALVLCEPVAYILRHPQQNDAPAASVKAYPKALGDKLLALCYQNGLSAEDIERATGIELHWDGRAADEGVAGTDGTQRGTDLFV